MAFDEEQPEIRVHPFADVFPMLSDEDLDELVLSIRENGLRHPILLSPDGQLIDGRNRLEACRRAGVEPRFETVDTADPVALILDENVRRRHLNKSQQAMAVAEAYPEPAKLKRAGSFPGKELEGVNSGMLAKARLVRTYTPDAAPLVLAGTLSLKDAYREAVERRERTLAKGDRFARLVLENPDLAARVRDEEMTLDDAEHEALSRRQEAEREAEEQRRQARIAAQNLSTILTLGGAYSAKDEDEGGAVREAKRWLASVQQNGGLFGVDLSPEACRSLGVVLTALAILLEKEAA